MKQENFDLITRVGERLGFGATSPDSDGACTFDFGSTFVHCALSEEGEMVRLTCPVAQVPQPCPRTVLERLLDAQFFFKETRGCTFSYQSETGAILLHLNVQTGALDPVLLENAINNMVAVSNAFAQEISDLLEQAQGDSQETPSMPDPNISLWG